MWQLQVIVEGTLVAEEMVLKSPTSGAEAT